jgi:SNF2 family DNA or RNA helicase
MQQQSAGLITSTSPRVNSDAYHFRLTLKPHQKALLYRLLLVEQQLQGADDGKAYGVMSDQPGAGKTFAALALVYISKQSSAATGPTLIVVPHNIYSQWEEAIVRLLGGAPTAPARLDGASAPPMPLLTYTRFVDYSDISRLYFNQAILGDYDILLTTSLYYDAIATTLASVHQKTGFRLSRVMFDEADSIKACLAHPVPTRMTWFVSASIGTVFSGGVAKLGSYEVRLSELLRNECKCDPDFVNAHIVIDPADVRVLRTANPIVDGVLRHILRQEEVAGLHAMDYARLVAKLEYRWQQVTSDAEAMRAVDDDVAAGIKELTEELARLGPALTKATQYGDLERAQTLREEVDKAERRLKMCTARQGAIDERSAQVVQAVRAGGYPAPWSKMDRLRYILNQNHMRVIIFSLHHGTFKFVRALLDELRVPFCELDGGNVASLDAAVLFYKGPADAQEPQSRALLINQTVCGCGLNLENTSDIVFMHKLDDPLIESQVVGRAQRYGRVGTLRVWHLRNAGE